MGGSYTLHAQRSYLLQIIALTEEQVPPISDILILILILSPCHAEKH